MRGGVWFHRTSTSPAGKYPSRSATTGRQSIQSQYRASTELHTQHTFNTKHNTFNTEYRTPPAKEEPSSTTTGSERRAKTRTVHHYHRARSIGVERSLGS